MAFFASVPVVDVHKENFQSLWPSMVLAIKTSSFIAMDAELSGLGNRKNLLIRSIEDRYQSLADVARTRSVLSLGISCFKMRTNPARNQSIPASKDQVLGFLVQTFNLTTLCSENYTVEPGSLKFLVDHGFDFNKQYASGLPYQRGLDIIKDGVTGEDSQTLRALFIELIRSGKPVVFHNGLVDLVFLYQNLYSELPATSSQFISDLCEIFPGGIFDTKYLAEFQARMPASYLEYVFRKSQRDNARHANHGRPHVALEFCHDEKNSSFVGYHQCTLPPSFTNHGKESEVEDHEDGEKTTVDLCETYAAHGHCKDGIRCRKSHDPDAIQDADDVRTDRRKRKRKRKKQMKTGEHGPPDAKKDREDGGDGFHGDIEDEDAGGGNDGEIDDKDGDFKNDGEIQTGDSVNGSDNLSSRGNMGRSESGNSRATPSQDSAQHLAVASTPHTGSPQKKLDQQTGNHRAGYDAFMTGFIMATMVLTVGGRGSSPATMADGGTDLADASHLTESRNKLFLSAKPVPLLIAKSGFAKTSLNHRNKMKRLGITLS